MADNSSGAEFPHEQDSSLEAELGKLGVDMATLTKLPSPGAPGWNIRAHHPEAHPGGSPGGTQP